MAVTVLVPTPLQKLTGGSGEVKVEAASVAALVEALEAAYPGIKGRLCDDAGNLRRFVNVYVNNEDIRFGDNEQTLLHDGDEVSIIPAIAGG